MSVHAKDRRETATQYIITAQYLQIAVIKNMMNEKKVPKKWRYLFAYSVIKKVNELLDNVIASEKTFPNNEEKLEKRKGFTWLKTRFFLTQNGKIVRKPTQKNIVRERRRLKRQIKLVKDGVLSKSDLIQSFESWIGSMKRRNARLSVWKMRQILWSAKI